MSLATRPVTARELAEMPDGDRFELVRGEPVERYMGSDSVPVAILHVSGSSAAAWAIPSRSTSRGREGTIRSPDAAVVQRRRLVS